jgi:hypothetical protein
LVLFGCRRDVLNARVSLRRFHTFILDFNDTQTFLMAQTNGVACSTAKRAALPVAVASIALVLGVVGVAASAARGGEPSQANAYLRELARIEARAATYLSSNRHPGERQALILDIDDTTLLDDGSGSLRAGRLPPVAGMPALVNRASREGYDVFWITARPESVRRASEANLARAGYRPPVDPRHLFLKGPQPYLACGRACTTVQYKAGTRRYIASLGYRISADIGDHPSDLAGGFAGKTFKLPDP